jgi:hypothetical protein
MQRTLKKIVIAIDENLMKLADRTILITGGVDEGVSKLMAYMKLARVAKVSFVLFRIRERESRSTEPG